MKLYGGRYEGGLYPYTHCYDSSAVLLYWGRLGADYLLPLSCPIAHPLTEL